MLLHLKIQYNIYYVRTCAFVYNIIFFDLFKFNWYICLISYYVYYLKKNYKHKKTQKNESIPNLILNLWTLHKWPVYFYTSFKKNCYLIYENIKIIVNDKVITACDNNTFDGVNNPYSVLTSLNMINH